MNHTARLILCLILALPFAAGADFESSFRDGLAAHQTKDYAKAKTLFTEALSLQPGNTAAMTNLAITELELGENGLAIAWFRRALTLEPGLAKAERGLRYAQSKLEIKEIPHRLEFSETLRNDVLERAPARAFLGLTALLILTSGWLLLGWFGRRRRARESQELTPSFPPTAGLLLILTAVLIALTVLKIHDLSLPRGTIVVKKTPALSAPAENAPTLFELHEGFEVVILELKDDWIQVNYPGGLTGWVPKTAVLPSATQ